MKTDLVVLALLGEHSVVGSVLSQQADQELVGRLVTGVLQLAPDETAFSDLEQPVAGRGGQPGREGVVVHPQSGIEKLVVVGHGTEGYPSHSGHEQSEFGSLGSASLGSHLHGLKDPNVTTVDRAWPATR